MAVRHKVMPQHPLLVSVWRGNVTFADCLSHNSAIRADPAFDPDMRQISDARDATSALTADQVRAIARINAFGPKSRRAVIISDQVMHAVTRMYEAQVDESGEIAIFPTVEDGLRWLGFSEIADDVVEVISGLGDDMQD